MFQLPPVQPRHRERSRVLEVRVYISPSVKLNSNTVDVGTVFLQVSQYSMYSRAPSVGGGGGDGGR